MRIDVHSHLMSVAFLEHLRGRDAMPTAVRDGTGYIAHCAPGVSLPYRAPILNVEAKLADMDMAGIDLAVLSHGLPGPHMLGGAQADHWAARINDELAAIAAAHPGRLCRGESGASDLQQGTGQRGSFPPRAGQPRLTGRDRNVRLRGPD